MPVGAVRTYVRTCSGERPCPVRRDSPASLCVSLIGTIHPRAAPINVGTALCIERKCGEVTAMRRDRHHQLAGNFVRPRSTKVGRHCGLSALSSFSSGSRRKSVAIAISASIRASWAPRQRRSGRSGYTAGSRLAEPNGHSTLSPFGIRLPPRSLKSTRPVRRVPWLIND